MHPIVIKIEKKDYTSIGTYLDNNSGIFYYLPEQSVDNWIQFFESQEPIIILWLLSGIYYLEIDSEFEKSITESGGDQLILFLKKYCPDNILDEIFIDFIFGGYSNYGEEEFPEIYYEDKLVEHEDFDFSNHVFIQTDNYEKFIEELNDIINLIKKKLL